MYVLRSVSFIRAVKFQVIVEDSAMHVLNEIVCNLESAAVYRAFARYAYIVLLDCKHHCSPSGVGILDIVPGIEGSEQGGTGLKMKCDTGLEVNRTGKVVAGSEYHSAASVGAGKVDCRLDACACKSPSVRLCSEF